MYCVIKCVKKQARVKRQFCVIRLYDAKTQMTRILVTGPQCVNKTHTKGITQNDRHFAEIIPIQCLYNSLMQFGYGTFQNYLILGNLFVRTSNLIPSTSPHLHVRHVFPQANTPACAHVFPQANTHEHKQTRTRTKTALTVLFWEIDSTCCISCSLLKQTKHTLKKQSSAKVPVTMP
jgi:hypothetical protein